MPHYRRIRLPGGTHFFTVNLYDRSSRLLTDNIALLREAFARTRRVHDFRLIAISVMHEHLHCVWELPVGDADNGVRWQRIKSEFSRRVPANELRSPSRESRRERGLWQRRFWERAITTESDLQAHVDYVHRNPVKHGLVARVREWPYSSFHRYVREGIVSASWCDY